MVLLGFGSEDTQSAPANTWTEANLGDDATGSVNELSATNVNITAAGTSDSTDDGTIAYQTVSSGDIQLVAKIPETWLGTTENFTFFGVQLREALTGDPVILSCLSAFVEGGNKAKHRLTTDGSYVAYATGLTSMLRPKYLAITYDSIAHEVKYWESDDGVSNNYEQIGATVSITLSYDIYACLYGTSHNNAVTTTAALTNCSLGSSITISQKPPPATRKLRAHLSWESGEIQESGSKIDGLFTDGLRLQIITPKHAARTITDITDNDSTASATYTGTQVVEGDGLTLGTISSGMTEMSGRLIRVGPNPTSSSFELWQDGDDTGYDDNKILGDVRVSTVGYGIWTGTTTAQGWNAIHSSDGNPTIPTDADVRVVASITPPTNAIAGANPVLPLVGSYFLSTDIWYQKDYACENGISGALGNAGKNKPRWTGAIGSGQHSLQDEEEWFGMAINLPSNYDHEETLTGVTSRNQIYYLADSSGSSTCEIHLRGNGAGTDRWELDHNGASGVVLGSVADDVGKWTVFIIQVKPHATDGILKIWKSTGAYTTGFERVDELVFDVGTGNQVGPSSGTTYTHNIRQYKGSWHFNTATIDSEVFWVGFDEIRFGGQNEATIFEDVHPFQHSEPA